MLREVNRREEDACPLHSLRPDARLPDASLPEKTSQVAGDRPSVMRCSSSGPGRPDRFRLDQHARPAPATAAHGVELQPGGEDQRGPPLPSVARSMVQPPLTQADKIMLIWLAGMLARRDGGAPAGGKGRRLFHFGGWRGPAGKRAMTPTR